MEDRIIRIKEVINLTGIPRSTLYLYITKGEFPKQIQLTQGSVGWRLKEVVAFINSRQQVS